MLERLEPFIGEWDLEPSFPTLPGAHGRTVFEWALDGRFLVQRTEISVPEAPNTHLRSSASTPRRRLRAALLRLARRRPRLRR